MSKARDIADLDFNSPDIDGGNIDGATIGATTPAAGSFSTVSTDTFQNASGNLNILSTGNILFKFDSDNNQTNRELNIQSNTGDQLLRITETGHATFNGTISSKAITITDGTTNGASTIGSASDNLLLDTSGDTGITIRSGASSTGVVSFASPSDHNVGQVFYDHNTDSMVVRTNDDTGLTIDSSQNSTFEGNVTVKSGNKLIINRTDNATGGEITYGPSAGTGFIFNDANGDGIDFKTGSTMLMSIDSTNQRVGIGTSNINALLHVGGTAEAQGSQANPAIQIGSTTGYRLGMYTDAEGGYIENKNGDNGLIFKVKNIGEAVRIDGGTGVVTMSRGGTAFTPLTYDGLVIQNGDATGIRIIDAGNGGGNGGHCGIGNDNGNLQLSTAGDMMFDTGFQPTDQTYVGRHEKMRIHSAGYVTTPSQPSFGARGLSNNQSGGGTSGSNEVLVFSSATQNTGNHYSTSTGLFTAPVAGRYFATFSGLYNISNNTTGPAYIRRNTTELYRAYHHGSGNFYEQISCSGVVECAVGDTINIFSVIAGWHVGGETSFSVFYIG